MAFLLDTNACVDYLTGRYPRVAARIQGSSPEDLFVSVRRSSRSCRYGADHSARRRKNHARVDALIEEIESLDFDLRAAATYGRVRARLEAVGTPDRPERHADCRPRALARVDGRHRQYRQSSDG